MVFILWFARMYGDEYVSDTTSVVFVSYINKSKAYSYNSKYTYLKKVVSKKGFPLDSYGEYDGGWNMLGNAMVVVLYLPLRTDKYCCTIIIIIGLKLIF